MNPEIPGAVSKVLETPMHLQRPSSGHSQDVRHILARAFKDIYNRDCIKPDTVTNLQVSKGSDDAYHERYVESLQKVHTEWQQRMDEIAMLERHIMQAQAKAMSAEERELNKAVISCVNYKELGLPPGRAQFRSCIDTQLLHDYNLLAPTDYLAPDPPHVPAPRKPEIPAYARETEAFRKLSSLDAIESKAGKAMKTVGFLSDGETENETRKLKNKNQSKGHFPKKDGWREFLSEDQREADKKYLDLLQAKANFMQNPRFILCSDTVNKRSLLKPPDNKSKLFDANSELEIVETNLIVFVPSPPSIEFNNYKVGEVYEITLELKNVSTVMRQCRAMPPSSNAFSIGLGQFPGDSGLVAPGMSCTYAVRFTPYSLRNYDDVITVQVQATYPLIIPLKARRRPPVLTIPSEVDIGSCLVDGAQSVQLLVKNEGGFGKFCLIPKSKWPTVSIRSVLPNMTKLKISQPPFEIHPAMFELKAGQSTILDISFSPHCEKTFIQEMAIACDNCQVSYFKIKGEGEIARVNLVSVEFGMAEPMPGEYIDINAAKLLRFEDLNPFTYTERVAKISNCTKTELRYQWMVYKPILTSCFSDGQPDCNIEEVRVPDLHSAFNVFPSNGILQPSQIAEFRLTFAPAAIGSFHSVVHMILQKVPQKPVMPASGRKMVHDIEAQLNDDNCPTYDAGFTVSHKDITALGFELTGECVPLNVVLHPYALIILTPVTKGTTVKKLFTMANHSYSSIDFSWESYTETYIIEIEPPFGDLEPGMAIDFEISITGFQPGKISHAMICNILNMDEPLHFLVQAEIKGSELKIEQPSINFGLIRIGQCEIREMTIINLSEIVVQFTISDFPMDKESDEQDTPSELRFSDTSGELLPFGRKTVSLTLIPKLVRSIKRICQVQYEGDKTCSVGLYGEAQNPVVCFLECQKYLPEVYLKVPVTFTVVLCNQTLLSTTFKWGKALGSQCDDCQIEVHEQEGEINSWQQKTVSINFTPLKAVSFSDVSLPCHIAGQDDDIYISINCEVRTLAVSFKMSTDGRHFVDSDQLNFGDHVVLGEIVNRYVHICNQTAISAPYSVTVQHFATPTVPLSEVSDTVASQKSGLLKRTVNIGPGSKTAEKAKQDYSKLVLRRKKGAAFMVQPPNGELKPFTTQIIQISAYNDLWGSYNDNLILKVGDLEEKKMSMTLNVIGCPLNFQLTGGLPGQEIPVRFGSHFTGMKSVTRKLRINNPSPNDIRVDWQIFRKVDASDKLLDFITYYNKAFPLCDTFGTEITETSVSSFVKEDKSSVHMMNPTGARQHNSLTSELRHIDSLPQNILSDEKYKFIFCHLQPHEGVRIKTPFSVKPSQLVIPAGASNSVDFIFNLKSISDLSEEINFDGYVRGYLNLDIEDENSEKVVRPEAYKAEQLQINFTANVKPPLLTVEDLEEDGMRFMTAVSDIIQNDEIQSEFLKICSMKLTNDTLTPLTFKMKVKEPFLLVDLDPCSTKNASDRSLETSYCTLKSKHYLVCKVAFRVSLSLLPEAKATSRGSLSDIQRKLNFEDYLSIRYVNEASQKVPLYATVTIPQMEVSDDYLDFGTCLVGQTRELDFQIINMTTSESYWNIYSENRSNTCDDDTFKVQPRKGFLEAFVTCTSKRKATVKISFTATHSDAYDCTFIVQGLLGEYPRRIVVVGQGSYDGKHETILEV